MKLKISDALQQFKSAAKYYDYKGSKIAYWQQGQGPALVCIHGFPTASYDWHLLIPQLSKQYTVIAIDMLGFGFSDKPQQSNYTIALQADIIESVLFHLDIDTCHILAHDYGDTVAQELLARFLERSASKNIKLRINKIVLLNGGLFPEQHRPRPIQKLLRSPLGFIVSRLITYKSFAKSFAQVFGPNTQPNQAILADCYALSSYNNGNHIAHKLLHYIPERIQFRARWVGALQKSTIPIRLICGLADPVSGAHMAAHYIKLVPNPDVISLPTIGHYPQLEQPEQVTAAVIDFLNY